MYLHDNQNIFLLYQNKFALKKKYFYHTTFFSSNWNIFYHMNFSFDIFLVTISAPREKCPNTEFFLVRIFLYLDKKKLCIWTLFTQCWSSVFIWKCQKFIFGVSIKQQRHVVRKLLRRTQISHGVKNTKKLKCHSISYNYFYDYMQLMFRKIIKGLEQSLPIICKDSIQQLFRKIFQNMISMIPRKALILGLRFS